MCKWNTSVYLCSQRQPNSSQQCENELNVTRVATELCTAFRDALDRQPPDHAVIFGVNWHPSTDCSQADGEPYGELTRAYQRRDGDFCYNCEKLEREATEGVDQERLMLPSTPRRHYDNHALPSEANLEFVTESDEEFDRRYSGREEQN